MNPRKTAIHEAGHAVALRRLWPGGRYAGELSIVSDGVLAGFHQQEELMIPVADNSPEADEALHNEAIVCCAGYAACIAHGYSEDEAAAGCDSDFEKVDTKQLDAMKREAVELMRKPENLQAVERVADELLKRERIDGQTVDVLLEVAFGESSEADYRQYLQMTRLESVTE